MRELSARNLAESPRETGIDGNQAARQKLEGQSASFNGNIKMSPLGSSMYTNKHAWTNKDGTYKEVYYYICGRNKQERTSL